MNIVRIILAILAIILLIAALPHFDAHNIQFAVLPFVCYLFAFAAAFRFVPSDDETRELKPAPRSVASRAPPLS